VVQRGSARQSPDARRCPVAALGGGRPEKPKKIAREKPESHPRKDEGRKRPVSGASQHKSHFPRTAQEHLSPEALSLGRSKACSLADQTGRTPTSQGGPEQANDRILRPIWSASVVLGTKAPAGRMGEQQKKERLPLRGEFLIRGRGSDGGEQKKKNVTCRQRGRTTSRRRTAHLLHSSTHFAHGSHANRNTRGECNTVYIETPGLRSQNQPRGKACRSTAEYSRGHPRILLSTNLRDEVKIQSKFGKKKRA